MGYYSDIKLDMSAEVYDALRKFAEQDDDVREMLQCADGDEDCRLRRGNPSPYASMFWSNVKWFGYEDDNGWTPGVCKIERFLRAWPESHYFIEKLGEDGDRGYEGLLCEREDSPVHNPLRKMIESVTRDYGPARTAEWLKKAARDLEKAAKRKNGVPKP